MLDDFLKVDADDASDLSIIRLRLKNIDLSEVFMCTLSSIFIIELHSYQSIFSERIKSRNHFFVLDEFLIVLLIFIHESQHCLAVDIL